MDKINQPEHYQGKKECIEIIKDFMTEEQLEGYLTGNIIKYLYRWKNKNGVEDLKKANWYLNYLIKRQNEDT
jgi:hypothetical protein